MRVQVRGCTSTTQALLVPCCPQPGCSQTTYAQLLHITAAGGLMSRCSLLNMCMDVKHQPSSDQHTPCAHACTHPNTPTAAHPQAHLSASCKKQSPSSHRWSRSTTDHTRRQRDRGPRGLARPAALLLRSLQLPRLQARPPAEA